MLEILRELVNEKGIRQEDISVRIHFCILLTDCLAAADPLNWPDGIVYDPDNSGKPLTSLGTHEHWNNAGKKQYSRNLGRVNGIELVSIPDTLVKN